MLIFKNYYYLKNTPQSYTLLLFSAVIEITMAERGWLVGMSSPQVLTLC